VETIQQLKEMAGVKGVHIMAIEWEEVVGEIVEKAGLLPRPAFS
jgi:methylenetetrahydrofolate reductase (NADPH)